VVHNSFRIEQEISKNSSFIHSSINVSYGKYEERLVWWQCY